nr:dihydrofolate reductase family protein [Brevibacterium yomogidense]
MVGLYLDRTNAPRNALHTEDPGRPWVRANMVTTVDGAVTGSDSLSGTISSPADKRVFSVLRSVVDAVVVGAGTARAERYTRLHAKPRHAEQRRNRGQVPAPLLVLVSRSGRFDLDRIDAAGSGRVVVHAVEDACDAERRALIVDRLGDDALILHEDSVEPGAVLTDLRTRGCREILHEGGPDLLGDWMDTGAIDELCLTTSPLLAGAPPAGAPRGLLDDHGDPAATALRLLSLVSDGTTLIQRWGLPLPG